MKLSQQLGKKLGQKGSFLRSVGTLFAGRVSAQLLSLLLMPLVTRLFMPEDIGLASIAIVFAGILSTVGSLKLDIAIVSEKCERNALALLKLCIFLVLPMSVLSTAIAWLLKKFSLLGYGGLPQISILLIFFLLLFISLQNVFRLYFVRVEKYWTISIQGISYSGFRMSLMILGGYFWPTWLVYLLSDLVGRASSVMTVLRSIPWRMVRQVPLTAKRAKVLFRRHKKMVLIAAPSTLIGIAAVSLPIPLVARNFGVETAGFFAIVHRVVLGTSSLLGAAIADVFHARMAKRSRSESGKGFELFLKTTGLLTTVAVLPAVVLFFFAPDVFAFVFGEKWRLSGELARVVAPWAFFQLIVSPTSRIIFVYDWQGSKFLYDFLVLGSTLFAFYYGGTQGWSIKQTVSVLSVLNCLAYSLFFAVIVFRIRGVGSDS